MKHRLGAPVLALLAVSAVLAGCGGGGGHKVSANEYMTSVCTAAHRFESATSAQQQHLNALDPGILVTGLTAGSSAALDQTKKNLEAFLDNVDSAAKTFQKSMHSAGTPDVPNGSHLASALNGSVDKTVALIESFRADVGKVSTSSPDAFQRGLQTLETKYQSSMNGVSNEMSNLNSPELQAAAGKVAACTNA